MDDEKHYVAHVVPIDFALQHLKGYESGIARKAWQLWRYTVETDQRDAANGMVSTKLPSGDGLK